MTSVASGTEILRESGRRFHGSGRARSFLLQRLVLSSDFLRLKWATEKRSRFLVLLFEFRIRFRIAAILILGKRTQADCADQEKNEHRGCYGAPQRLPLSFPVKERKQKDKREDQARNMHGRINTHIPGKILKQF